MSVKIAIIDIDGTLCPSIFANIKHNDNSLLNTPEFKKKLLNVEPYEWAVEHDWSQYSGIDVITGRMKEHEKTTVKWLEKKLGIKPGIYHSVTWDDSYESREDSYHDYVRRKILMISGRLVHDLLKKRTVDVFEDDRRVTSTIISMWYYNFHEVNIYTVVDGAKLKNKYQEYKD